MELKKKRKRILRPVQKEPEILRIDPQTDEQLKLMWQDELVYGMSGAHCSNEKITLLSIPEIMERYENVLSEEQKLKLKEYENRNSGSNGHA